MNSSKSANCPPLNPRNVRAAAPTAGRGAGPAEADQQPLQAGSPPLSVEAAGLPVGYPPATGHQSGRSDRPDIRLYRSIRFVLYVQEVVTLQKKYLIHLHKKMKFTPFINYFNTLG